LLQYFELNEMKGSNKIRLIGGERIVSLGRGITACSFEAEECLVTPYEPIPVGSLYRHHTNWCRSSSKQPRTQVQIGKALTDQGYKQRGLFLWYDFCTLSCVFRGELE
jgi:hypothetical protein